MRKLAALIALAPLLFAQEPKRPRVLGVAHIALYVSDIEKSRAFYKDFLGFSEPFRLDKPDGSLSLTFIKVNERQYIELFPGLKAGADRLNHISIQTDDAGGHARLLSRLRAASRFRRQRPRAASAIPTSTSRIPMATPSRSCSTSRTAGRCARRASSCRAHACPSAFCIWGSLSEI